jgi:hypothetical protein
MEHILRNVLMASAMPDILRVLSDRDYRKVLTKSLRLHVCESRRRQPFRLIENTV